MFPVVVQTGAIALIPTLTFINGARCVVAKNQRNRRGNGDKMQARKQFSQTVRYSGVQDQKKIYVVSVAEGGFFRLGGGVAV